MWGQIARGFDLYTILRNTHKTVTNIQRGIAYPLNPDNSEVINRKSLLKESGPPPPPPEILLHKLFPY